MSFTSEAFDRRLRALERAEAGRHGRVLGDDTFSRIALARRLSARGEQRMAEPAALSSGPGLLLRA